MRRDPPLIGDVYELEEPHSKAYEKEGARGGPGLEPRPWSHRVVHVLRNEPPIADSGHEERDDAEEPREQSWAAQEYHRQFVSLRGARTGREDAIGQV